MSTFQPGHDLPDDAPGFPEHNAGTPSCCADLHRKVDRILGLLEARQPETDDGVYDVTIPPATHAQAYWEAKHVEALRAAGEANPSLMPQIIEHLAAAVRDLPELRHAATFQRRDNRRNP